MSEYPLRQYLMACYGRRRKPVRVPIRKYVEARRTATEWWTVTAHTADEARALCAQWPTLTTLPTGARILDHGKARR